MDPALLAGIESTHDSFFAMSTHNLPYQTSTSFHAGSMSTTEISPSTASLNSPFMSYCAPLQTHVSINPRSNTSVRLSTDSVSPVSPGHRHATNASFSSTASTSTPLPGLQHELTVAPHIGLSSGPQTKYEQQKLALEKLSRANIDIEDIVHRLLDAQQQQDDASQAIAELVKEKSTALRRQSNQACAFSPLQHCGFKGCTFTGRPCDLNKHRKRHDRPYGCTYPKCHKRFGAKSDWKRHENSQHFQLEVFRCDHQNSSGVRCGQQCHRPTQFQKHLTEQHGVTIDAHIKTRQQRCKIGKNCQERFWCGFCRNIEVLHLKRNKAWDERFDHIARHFEKEKKSIDDWLCVEENKTKKELQAEVDRDAFPDEMDTEVEAEQNDDQLPVAQNYYPPAIPGAFQLPIQDEPKTREIFTEKSKTILWTCVSSPCPLSHVIIAEHTV